MLTQHESIKKESTLSAPSRTPQQDYFIPSVWCAAMGALKGCEKADRGLVSTKGRGNACSLKNWRLSLSCFWKMISRYFQYWAALWQWILHIGDAILKCKRHGDSGFNPSFLRFTSFLSEVAKGGYTCGSHRVVAATAS